MKQSTFLSKLQNRVITVLAAVFLLSGSIPMDTVKAELLPEETITAPDSAEAPDEETPDDTSLSETIHAEEETESPAKDAAEASAENKTDASVEEKTDASDKEKTDASDEEKTVASDEEKTDASDEEKTDASDEDTETPLPEGESVNTPLRKTAAIPAEEENGSPVPDTAPPFRARIEFRQGYAVIGTFTDFTPDIRRIQTLYSLDGENWQDCRVDWNLTGIDNPDKLEGLQEQPCLFHGYEPLKSYIDREIDRFYLKLRITKENDVSYDTQSAVIERGSFQQLPEGTQCRASFSSDILVRERTPYYHYYGKYQLTVSADATANEISALLPDTLPVEIQLDNGPDFLAVGIVDCPVTWKPLSLPALSAGETITVPDAAEEILVPGGTPVHTPLGTFRLNEALSLDALPSTDEVRLVLNVCPGDGNPTGVLRTGKDGLEMAFHYKPTGAVSIQTYLLADGETNWTELQGLSLPETISDPSSAANSSYVLLLRNDQEPYRSYLTATAAGDTPTPFFIGLKIQGGTYDGRQLVLPWPDIYEQLPELPEFGGAGGNEGNAGADNRDDSTESGQRPNLPQTADNTGRQTDSLQTADSTGRQADSLQTADSTGRQTDSLQAADSTGRQTDSLQAADSTGQQMDSLQAADSIRQQTDSSITNDARNLPAAEEAGLDDRETGHASEQLPPDYRETAVSGNGQRPNLPPTVPDMENNRQIPFLPAAAVAMTGICIGAAVCKTTGYGLFNRIFKKIRKIRHKS